MATTTDHFFSGVFPQKHGTKVPFQTKWCLLDDHLGTRGVNPFDVRLRGSDVVDDKPNDNSIIILKQGYDTAYPGGLRAQCPIHHLVAVDFP
jgi:hypothetical protein